MVRITVNKKNVTHITIDGFINNRYFKKLLYRKLNKYGINEKNALKVMGMDIKRVYRLARRDIKRKRLLIEYDFTTLKKEIGLEDIQMNEIEIPQSTFRKYLQDDIHNTNE